jgi:hypothetical protein
VPSVRTYANCGKNWSGSAFCSVACHVLIRVSSIQLTFFVIQTIRLPFVDVILPRVGFYCQGRIEDRTN